MMTITVQTIAIVISWMPMMTAPAMSVMIRLAVAVAVSQLVNRRANWVVKKSIDKKAGPHGPAFFIGAESARGRTIGLFLFCGFF